MTPATRMTAPRLTSHDVRRVCGDIPEWKIEDIIATGASLAELEEGALWASGDNETTPTRHLPPHGAAAAVFDILTVDEDEDEGRAPAGES